MKKKLVAFDADGTIIDYNFGGIVAESTRNAIKKLKTAGHVPVIATGRSYNMISKLAEELGIEYIAVANGAQIFRGTDLIYSKDLGKETSMLLLDRTEGSGLSIIAVDAKNIYFKNITDKWLGFIYESIDSRSNLIQIKDGPYDFAQFYAFGDSEELEKVVDGIDGIEYHNNRIEVTCEGVDKGEALKWLAKSLGILIEDSLAFGDGLNDIPMLKAAGTGVAMGSGNPLAAESADDVTVEGMDAISDYLKSKGLIS